MQINKQGKIILQKVKKNSLKAGDIVYWAGCPSNVKIWHVKFWEYNNSLYLIPNITSPRAQTPLYSEISKISIKDTLSKKIFKLSEIDYRKAVKNGIGNIIEYELDGDIAKIINTNIKWDKYFTPLTLAKLTIVNKEMSEETYKAVNLVSTNWINWLKENFNPIKIDNG